MLEDMHVRIALERFLLFSVSRNAKGCCKGSEGGQVSQDQCFHSHGKHIHIDNPTTFISLEGERERFREVQEVAQNSNKGTRRSSFAALVGRGSCTDLYEFLVVLTYVAFSEASARDLTSGGLSMVYAM
jgi:hypothetical protein